MILSLWKRPEKKKEEYCKSMTIYTNDIDRKKNDSWDHSLSYPRDGLWAWEFHKEWLKQIFSHTVMLVWFKGTSNPVSSGNKETENRISDEHLHIVENRVITQMGHSVKYQKEYWLLNLVVFSI